MHQESQTANFHHDTLRHRDEILGSGQLETLRHRLATDADSDHARQGSQATSSSPFATIARRATGILETVQTYLAALSGQDTRQDLFGHHDPVGDQGVGGLGGHQQERHAPHLSTLLCDGTAGSGRRSVDDQSLVGTRQFLDNDGLPTLSTRALDQYPEPARLVASPAASHLPTRPRVASEQKRTPDSESNSGDAFESEPRSEGAPATTQQKLTVAQILRQGAAAYVRQHAASGACGVVQSTLAKLSLCRTPALGGKEYTCDSCGETKLVPHSCGDRHCPICSGRKRYDFAERAEQLILDGVTYYQVVFTLPSELSELALVNREAIADLLFTSAWKSLRKTIRSEQGYDPAAMMVLHTWNQRMDSHWHVHALVPGGGPSLSEPEAWKQASAPEQALNSDGFYLVDAICLRELFRKVAIAHLKRLRQSGKLVLRGKFAHLTDDAQWQQFCDKLKSVDWVSYIQPPPTDACTADQVVRYLTRYLTGGPISDSRILAADEHEVTFHAREGRVTGGERVQVPVTVSTPEFIQRWCMHIQPSQLTKTRYCGGWSSRRRTQYVEYCQELRGSTDFDPVIIEAMDDASKLSQIALGAVDGKTDKPSAPICPQCENQPMRLTGQIPKPSWYDILQHTDPRCPAWYAEREKESWIKFLDTEYGVDYETWCLETPIESAIGDGGSATDFKHRQTPSSHQLYFPGLEPERYYLLESLEAACQNSRQ